jgi:hypothetical protein
MKKDFRWSRDIKLSGDISEFEASGNQIPQSPGFPGLVHVRSEFMILRRTRRATKAC